MYIYLEMIHIITNQINKMYDNVLNKYSVLNMKTIV